MTESTFKSALDQPIKRALSQWLRDAFDGKMITHAGFIDYFGIMKVIQKLSAEVRGQVFCTCNGGGDPKRAAKMNSEIVASTIESMLKDSLITETDVCKEISTDHMVEVLPSQELYSLVFGKPGEKKRWLYDDKESDASRAFMARAHAVILTESLLGDETPESYIKELGIDKIVHEQTPTVLLVLGQTSAYEKNSAKEIFSAADFLGIYAPRSLVSYVDLADLFPVVEAVARLNAWVEPPASKPVMNGLPEGVVTPSELPPGPPPLPKSGDDEEPVMSVEGAGPGGDADLELDVDDLENDGDEDQTQVLQRDSAAPKQPSKRRARQGG